MKRRGLRRMPESGILKGLFLLSTAQIAQLIPPAWTLIGGLSSDISVKGRILLVRSIEWAGILLRLDPMVTIIIDRLKNQALLALLLVSIGCQSVERLKISADAYPAITNNTATASTTAIESATAIESDANENGGSIQSAGNAFHEVTDKPAVRTTSFTESAEHTPDSISWGDLDYLPTEGEIEQSPMTIEEFESLALANNPTIRELAATTQKAAGFRTQVGLRANPSVGYVGVQIADRGTDQHAVFLSQSIITANKLELNRCVLNEAIRAQLMQLEAQKYRIVTDVRVKFYDALASQQRVRLIREFQTVVNKGLELSELRKRAQEASQLDVVQARVQKNEVDLALRQAEVSLAAALRELSALSGTPEWVPNSLAGELPTEDTQLDWATLAHSMISASPEYQAAQNRVSQARASLNRQCVQAVPNLETQLAAGVDNGTNSGFMNVQIGAPIPVFNKNQGNIAAARAELFRASQEVERVENSIKARLAAVSGEYDSALAAVRSLANDILPNAIEGLGLAEAAYQVGETSFVQVLIARRSYFETNLQFISSRSQLAQARARLDGFVLTGCLEPVTDGSGDDSLRGLTFSQQ